MPKPVREFEKPVDARPEPAAGQYLLNFDDETIDAGAAAMYRAWQETDEELRKTWSEADENLKATFRRQFRTGMIGAIYDGS